MAHSLNAINSAYLAAQREVDVKLGYSNPYAMPLAIRAITAASEALGPNVGNLDVVNAAFSGRLRGTVLKVMRARKTL
jgi:hypothetical protein